MIAFYNPEALLELLQIPFAHILKYTSHCHASELPEIMKGVPSAVSQPSKGIYALAILPPPAIAPDLIMMSSDAVEHQVVPHVHR